jgi:hypothetical protein
MNRVTLRPSFVKQICVKGSGSPSPTPPSPEANRRETPRAPVQFEYTKGFETPILQLRTQLSEPVANTPGKAFWHWKKNTGMVDHYVYKVYGTAYRFPRHLRSWSRWFGVGHVGKERSSTTMTKKSITYASTTAVDV